MSEDDTIIIPHAVNGYISCDDLLESTQQDLDHLKGLVKEFFKILDRTETSDSGREFRPTYIHSCRVLEMRKISKVLNEMKSVVNENIKKDFTKP